MLIFLLSTEMRVTYSRRLIVRWALLLHGFQLLWHVVLTNVKTFKVAQVHQFSKHAWQQEPFVGQRIIKRYLNAE